MFLYTDAAPIYIESILQSTRIEQKKTIIFVEKLDTSFTAFTSISMYSLHCGDFLKICISEVYTLQWLVFE